MVLEAVSAIALGLLALSGLAKILDPLPATGAMRAAGLPSSSAMSVAIGCAELTGAAFALSGSRTALFVAAAMYASFLLFVGSALLHRLPIQSCGCFGRDDTPPTFVHLFFNLAAASGLAAIAVKGAPPVPPGLDTGELAVWVTFAAIGVGASYVMLSYLPKIQAVKA